MSKKNLIIKVIGVGGAGINTINTMIKAKVSNVEFYAVNTDEATLKNSLANNKILIGNTGFGVGGNAELGKKYATESVEKLKDIVLGADMVIITAGMGGGTGTGVAPIIAKLAKEQGILTVVIVTKPLSVEGTTRLECAIKGIEEIRQYTDTLFVIPNDKICSNIDNKTSLKAVFEKIDDTLMKHIESITDTITKTGDIISIDFADITKVLTNSKDVAIGVGIGETYEEAFKKAVTNIFVKCSDIKNANNVLINIFCSKNNPFTLGDSKMIKDYINKEFKNSKFTKFATVDNFLDNNIKVLIITSCNKR